MKFNLENLKIEQKLECLATMIFLSPTPKIQNDLQIFIKILMINI